MEPIDGPIRWGIAGTGRIAHKFVTDFARLDDSAQIMAVGSRSATSAMAFADEHGIGQAHDGYEALASDPDIDAVYVAGIIPVHAPQTEMFLDAGKHVLVEKPMALDAAQVDAMTAAAERNDRFLMEAMWTRFNPAHVEMMRRIDDGAIGEVRRVIADFSIPVPFDKEHRLWDRAKGGGALLDLGIYPMTLAWWPLGPPGSVAAAGHLSTTGIDDEISLLCSWDSGATASLTAGLRLPGSVAARIEGTEGWIELPAPLHCTDRLTIHRGGESEEVVAAPAGLHHQVVEVHRCLRAGEHESPRMPWATSRQIMATCDAVREELGVRYDAE